MTRAARLLGACFVALPASAADYQATSDTYREQLATLRAGDALWLAPGVYTRGLPLHNMAGEAGRAILIAAARADAPPRFEARRGANTVSLVNVRHITLRGLELVGHDLPVDAIKAEGHSRYADFVTLENLVIRDYAASQQNVGISTKCPAFGWIVRGNRIERVGTGMYFGDSDGSDPFVGGLIEANHVNATLGYSLQIKHQRVSHPSYAGQHDTVIRDNRFSKADNASTAAPRPNVLIGHGPLSGDGQASRVLIQGNYFYGNPTEALLQAEGRVAIYDNVFVNATGDAIHIQPHNDVPRDVWVFSNSVLASGVGIRVLQPSEPRFVQRVVGNLVAAASPWQGGAAAFNVGLGYQAGLVGLDAAALVTAMRAQVLHLPHMPTGLQDELALFPGWARRGEPGVFQPCCRSATLPSASD